MKITITNGKGGTGKTTLNTFLAEWLYSHGKTVLLIDLDSNCSLSEVYEKTLCDRNSKQLLSGLPTIPYQIKRDGNATLDIIPSDLDLDMLQNIMDSQLKNQLKKQGFEDRYEYILIDPPGTWNSQTRNAVFAADSIVVVGKCSPLDFVATQKYIAKLDECGFDDNITVACNSYSFQTDPDKIWEMYQKAFKDKILESPIPKMNSLKRLAANSDYRIRSDLQDKLGLFVKAATREQMRTNPTGGEK